MFLDSVRRAEQAQFSDPGYLTCLGRGADLPLLLIFVGVVGGLIAFGVIGIFVGPVLLAVTYTLAREWVAEGVLGS
jgi:predicted PurR-regulated permease PerM